MPIAKEFTTIQDRIKILENRNLKFRNKEKAVKILQKYNYFDVINGFESILLKKNTKNKEFENVYFEDFYDLYKFDLALKKHTFFFILDVESRMRTSISYHFTKENCASIADTLNYLDPLYYQAPCSSNKHLTNVFTNFELFRKQQVNNKGRVVKKAYIDALKNEVNYIKQYNDPPFWVTIKKVPFGTLYYIYLFLTQKVQEEVLNDFEFDINDNNAFQQAVFILKEMRNQCAHLELVTRFRLKRVKTMNYFNEITKLSNLTQTEIYYIDVMKIFKQFGSITRIKLTIFSFYIKMVLKGRKHIADTILGKMGRKNIFDWLKL